MKYNHKFHNICYFVSVVFHSHQKKFIQHYIKMLSFMSIYLFTSVDIYFIQSQTYCTSKCHFTDETKRVPPHSCYNDWDCVSWRDCSKWNWCQGSSGYPSCQPTMRYASYFIYIHPILCIIYLSSIMLKNKIKKHQQMQQAIQVLIQL